MMRKVQMVTARDPRELERLVQLAIDTGWRRIGLPVEVTYNGTMERRKWQQAMRRI